MRSYPFRGETLSAERKMDTASFLILTLSACVGICSACSCFPEKGPQRFCKYDLIVRGTPAAEYKERDGPLDHSDDYPEFDPFAEWVYTIDVEQAIVVPSNLTSEKMIKVRTPTQESLCGTRLALDVPHVIFARFNGDGAGELETYLCDPNTWWDSMTDWEQELITEHVPDFCANEGKVVAPPEP